MIDPAVLQHPEIFFNAGRLDRSLALRTEDYRRVAAEAEVDPIAAAPS